MFDKLKDFIDNILEGLEDILKPEPEPELVPIPIPVEEKPLKK